MKETVREMDNAANSAVEEAATDIKAKSEAKGAERDRAESEVRSWDEADIREEAEKTRAEAGAKVKDDTEAAERARAWDEAKEKAEIARFAAEAREKAQSEAAEREKAWNEAIRRQRLPGSLPGRVKRWRPSQRQES